jgi:hypothetical protein
MQSQRRLGNSLVFVAIVCLAACETPTGDSGSGQHMSAVGMESGSYNKETQRIEGNVGAFLSAKITYSIGFIEPGEGPVKMAKSDITEPEYQLFGDGLPPGLSFDPSTGVVKGIPTAPGKWQVYPAVRDTVRGDDVYNGHGFWFTEDTRFNGQIWLKSKTPITISIT